MATYYMDTSAFIKRYLQEPGSDRLNQLLERSGQESFFSSELIVVEVACALARAERTGRIDPMRRTKVVDLVLGEMNRLLDLAPVSSGIVRDAVELASRHPLRAYDAVHLATALDLATELVAAGLSAPCFASADAILLAAAAAEGLKVENPCDHD